jgi:hypothetical protein
MINEHPRTSENTFLSWKVYVAVGVAAVALFGVGLAASEEFRSQVGDVIGYVTPDIVNGPVYDPMAPPNE